MTVAAYLVELNAALEARIGRRRRILVEVEDHLREAVAAELERGRSQRDAEAAATAAFGDPVTVAKGFGSDPLARVTRRLVLAGQRLDRWMGQHPWRGAALAASVPSAAYLVAAAVGVVLRGMPVAIIPFWALTPFPLTFLVWGAQARSLRKRSEEGLFARATAARKQGGFAWFYTWWLGLCGILHYHELAGRSDVWNNRFSLPILGLFAAGQALAWSVRYVWQRSAGTSEGEWEERHPWAAALSGYSVSLGFAWLVILASDVGSPLDLRLAVAILVVSFVSVSLLCKGSLSSRKSELVLQYALVTEQRVQESLTRPEVDDPSEEGEDAAR
ncbi:MAG TPA: hypothetical protein VK988_08625 [Acidimicrobiales bacterium]|nr:hypothetical protein [Acidimicrobiales bacterium]